MTLGYLPQKNKVLDAVVEMICGKWMVNKSHFSIPISQHVCLALQVAQAGGSAKDFEECLILGECLNLDLSYACYERLNDFQATYSSRRIQKGDVLPALGVEYERLENLDVSEVEFLLMHARPKEIAASENVFHALGVRLPLKMINEALGKYEDLFFSVEQEKILHLIRKSLKLPGRDQDVCLPEKEKCGRCTDKSACALKNSFSI